MYNRPHKGTFWTPNEALTFDPYIIFVRSARDVGKTFGVKKWKLEQVLKGGAPMVWLRRLDNHITTYLKQSFLLKVFEAYPDLREKVKSTKIDGNVYYVNDRPYAIFGAVSVPTKLRGNEFDADTIVLDEYQIRPSEHSRYSPEESFYLQDIASTVFRKRKKARMFLLGNNMSVTDPYSIDYDVPLDASNRFVWINRERRILLENATTENYFQSESETATSKMFTESYASMATYNNVLGLDNENITRRTGDYMPLCRLYFEGSRLSIWRSAKTGLFLMCDHFGVVNQKSIFSLTTEDKQEQPFSTYIKNYKIIPTLSTMMNAYNRNEVRYENLKMKGICERMFAKLL